MDANAQAVAAAMEAALEAVEKASIPDDLREVAFGRAFDALAPNQDGRAGKAPAVLAPDALGNGARDGDSSIDKAAAKLGLEPGSIERVLDVDEDGVHLMLPRSRFDKKKSQAVIEVATLVVGVRQAAGFEEWTSLARVRQATEDLGVDDPSNFASHIRKLPGVRSQGHGKTGELKMNSVGFEAAAALIRRLGGEAS